MADAILNIATETDVDLVVGTRGRGRIATLALGSVSYTRWLLGGAGLAASQPSQLV